MSFWAVSSLPPGLTSFIVYFHFAFLVFTLDPLLTSPRFSSSVIFFDFIFLKPVLENLSTLHIFVQFQGVSGTADRWPWLQVCASICLTLCTETHNSFIRALNAL